MFNKKRKKYRVVSVKISPNELIIYTVLNTGVNMGLGAAVIMVCTNNKINKIFQIRERMQEL